MRDICFAIECFEVEGRGENNYANDCTRVLKDVDALVNSKASYGTNVLTPLGAVLITLPTILIVGDIYVDGVWVAINRRSKGVIGNNGVNYDM